eukprot:Blabericola_migrator_1__2026@NODE_1552_length_4299_cov_243_952032_g1017_i0_p1_GENE_NODE_1552_length_4299_cov_243_952032_g1017_i0NODE_1552_length_4299_cov_243_952032_g1017_i0_p1_ORF_typecomplete_len327_score33_22_NODE_1552_length_4299_cov_243_952032_g1017_i030784058
MKASCLNGYLLMLQPLCKGSKALLGQRRKPTYKFSLLVMHECSRYAVRVKAKDEEKGLANRAILLAPLFAVCPCNVLPDVEGEEESEMTQIFAATKYYSPVGSNLVVSSGGSGDSVTPIDFVLIEILLLPAYELVQHSQERFATFVESYSGWTEEQQTEFSAGHTAISLMKRHGDPHDKDYCKHPLIGWLTGAELQARVSFKPDMPDEVCPLLLAAWSQVSEELFGPSLTPPEVRDMLISEALAFDEVECPASKRVADWMNRVSSTHSESNLRANRAATLIQCAIGELPLQFVLWQLINGRPQLADALVNTFENKCRCDTIFAYLQ